MNNRIKLTNINDIHTFSLDSLSNLALKTPLNKDGSNQLTKENIGPNN